VSLLVLIEDDRRIRDSLERALRGRGYAVHSAETGIDGLSQVVDHRPDAVLLDLGLPDVDGFELLKMIRAISRVPVIAATGRDDEGQIVRTLDAGADDYVIKPFSLDELDARVRAVLRRSTPSGAPEMVVGGLRIDTSTRVATLEGVPLELTRKEFDVLAYLAWREGRVVSRRSLLADIWGLPWGGGDKTIDVHLSWLRRKLGETAAAPRYLRVIRGVGVKLVNPDE
jgi:two-component system, OmpR family, KDP operon response regulator KdpE